jgi:peroxiredoxin family protein
VTAPAYSLAAVVSTAELERFYSGLSVLVSTAADGEKCAALAAFGGLAILLDEDLYRRAQEPEATPSLSWAGRETFASSLLELRDTALELESLSLFACSASVESMSLTPLAVEERLAGVMSTPRFLRETRGASFLFV